jgi:AmmeMemoRadiSam system protein A
MATKVPITDPGRPAASIRPLGVPRPVLVSSEERAELLGLARMAVRVAVGLEPADTVGALLAARAVRQPPQRCAAAFVTLTEDGELRGCIGTLDGTAPVGEAVAWAAMNAARRDPRFEPVDAAELSSLHLDVSVLGPMVRLADPVRFRPGIDGLVVEAGFRRGLLLPEVATMAGLDQRGMLEATCRKAGLPPGAWCDPATAVHAFRTARFGGPVGG